MQHRIIKTLALVIGASFLLTACDPPMPPEVKAALAEQSYTCIEGDTQLAATEAIETVAGDWQASVEGNCPGMTITPTSKITDATELQIGVGKCVPYASVPFAVDAVVLAVQLTDITSVNLDAKAIQKIWSGEITMWDDPAIVALNPNFSMPNTPVSFGSDLEAKSAAPLSDWLKRSAAVDVQFSGGTAKLDAMTEGAIVVASYSKVAALGITMVGITTEAGRDGVLPEQGSLASAASMFKGEKFAFDAKAKPIAPEGVAVAPAPYQAVNLIWLNLCGTDSLKTRAAARYILRQDSQGSLGLSTVVALPENIRVLSLTQVSKGLPEPVITEQPN